MFCSPCFSQFSAHTFKKNARRIKKAQDVIFAVISQCQHNLLACTKSEHIAPLFSTLRRCLTTQIRMLLLCCLTLQTQKAKRENIYTHTWVYTLPSALTTATTKRCFFIGPHLVPGRRTSAPNTTRVRFGHVLLM